MRTLVAAALAAGEVQWVDAVPLNLISEIKDSDELGYFTSFSAGLPDYLALNTTLPPFDNVKLRQAVAWAIDRLCETLKAPVPVVMITKGMHADSARLTALPDHVAMEVKRRAGIDLKIAAIGGPCIAGELAVRRHTGTVITAHDLGLAQKLCAFFATDYYHPRVSADVIGVEICAAFKNFFAIAVGWAAGHHEKMAATANRAFNHNAAAIIFDQAIRELMVLVRAHGGSGESVWGMPGAGDLYVTCQAGRNSRLGHNLGRGLTYRQTKEGPMKGDTIEGAELGVKVAGTLRAMMAAGTLDAATLPLTNALLDTRTA